jgi:NAD(P)H-hydrate epimerase
MTPKKTTVPAISSREMRALEANAEYFGISLVQLMENAGRNVAAEIASRFETGKSVAIFCGLGGNGGDGFVAARHLLSLGFKVTVVLAGRARDIDHEASQKNFYVSDSSQMFQSWRLKIVLLFANSKQT